MLLNCALVVPKRTPVVVMWRRETTNIIPMSIWSYLPWIDIKHRIIYIPISYFDKNMASKTCISIRLHIFHSCILRYRATDAFS